MAIITATIGVSVPSHIRKVVLCLADSEVYLTNVVASNVVMHHSTVEDGLSAALVYVIFSKLQEAKVIEEEVQDVNGFMLRVRAITIT